MTCQHDFFCNFQYCQHNSIFLADDTKHTPYEKGVVKVFLLGIGEKMISNVWYVPTFKKKIVVFSHDLTGRTSGNYGRWLS